MNRPSYCKPRRAWLLIPAVVTLVGFLTQAPALANREGRPDRDSRLSPGDLLVSGSVFQDDPNITKGVTELPPGCVSTCVTAIAGGDYPSVFNNDTVDSSFGVTSKISLTELTPTGRLMGSLEVPNSSSLGLPRRSDQMVTSFSSKSEMALNLSTSGRYVSFMGYNAPVGAVDVSNSNTPGVIDQSNPVPGAYFRTVATLDAEGRFRFTETNAYSGNNGRAAILSDSHGANALYTAGNAGNGANPQPAGVVLGAGAQIMQPARQPESAQKPGAPTPVGSFSVTQLGDKADKIGKDDNFRGMTLYGNVLYYTKGSGSNGVNTVYFVDTTGHACPTGIGVPAPGAPLPTATLAYDAATGLTPNNMCVLPGFPTELAKTSTNSFPFGLWFANPNTLYVAQEGDGTNTYSTATGQYTAAAASASAGLQKWVFNSSTASWQLAYTIQSGLNLGTPYAVPAYPTGDNPVTALPWAPATDGLRNITGRVNRDGTVSIWAVTSTVSGSGDQGADPNQLVVTTDAVRATALPSSERFTTVRAAANRTVLRGVSFTPGTDW